MLLFSRSFRMIRFLNQRHGVLTRTAFTILGFAATLLSTGSWKLATSSGSEFWSSSFKPAGRRVGWYLRTSWLKLSIAHDPFFNFTEDATPEIVDRQWQFLKNRKPHLSQTTFCGDALLIHAHKAHHALLNNDQAEFADQKRAYKKLIADILNTATKQEPAPHTQTSEEKTYEDFPTLAATVLQDFADIADDPSWDWFVTGGTLLGAVRQQDFLPHDNDLDVGMSLSNQQIDSLTDRFRATPLFTVTKLDMMTEVEKVSNEEFHLKQTPAFLKLVHQNGVNIDIFFHEDRAGLTVHGSGTMMWENTKFDLGKYTLGTQEVLGPKDADTYLTEHYGNWRQEKKEFSCVTDTTNIGYVRNFFAIAFHIKRLVFLKTADPDRAEMIERSMLQQGLLVRDLDGLRAADTLFG